MPGHVLDYPLLRGYDALDETIPGTVSSLTALLWWTG